jgi:hypothetical protein
MITAEECRLHAAECKALASSIDITSQRSREKLIMALNWEALADQIDQDNSRATEARLVALIAGLFRPVAPNLMRYWPTLSKPPYDKTA